MAIGRKIRRLVSKIIGFIFGGILTPNYPRSLVTNTIQFLIIFLIKYYPTKLGYRVVSLNEVLSKFARVFPFVTNSTLSPCINSMLRSGIII